MASEPAAKPARRTWAPSALLLATAVTAAAAWVPTAAHGQPGKAGASDRETARHLMDLGREKFAAGDYEAALESYRGADRIMGVPTTGLAVADALIELGRLIEARDKLLQVTRLPTNEDEPKPFAKARARARELSPELAARIPSLRVEVLSIESERPIADAAVRIDGESHDAASVRLPRTLDPGRHTLAANAPGFKTAVRSIEVGEGEHHLVNLVLRPVDEGGTESIGDVSPLVWIGFGFTVAGCIVGAATGSAALAKSAALENDCPDGVCPAAVQDTVDSMNLLSHVSTVSFIVAGAGAVVGAIGIVLTLDGKEPEESLAAVAPYVGPGFAGVRGRF